MLKNNKKIKYKNDTSDIVAEIARRMDTTPQRIRKEFQFFWQDLGISFTHMLGYGTIVDHFGHFLLAVKNADKYAKKMEKKIYTLHGMLDIYHLNVQADPPKQVHERMVFVCNELYDYLTRLILLRCSLNAYENDILKVYPKKYKPKRVYLDQLFLRFEEYYCLPVAALPVQIMHPIQEVFVRKMQASGFLPNPVFHKGSKVQPMWLHYQSKNCLSNMQLPFKFLDQTN
jgi:hypothetical protein